MASTTHTVRTGAGHGRALATLGTGVANALVVDRTWAQDPKAFYAKRFGHPTAPRPEEAAP